MTPPTQKLTTRAAVHLDEEVALAVRVRTCEPGSARPTGDAADRSETSPGGPVSPFPAGGFPIVPMVRGVKRSVNEMISADHDEVSFVLAFTRSGERVLMGRDRFRSLRPTGVVRRFKGDTPIVVDLTLLSEQLIPEITVDGECFIVNSVDFGVLTRAVVTGELDEPELAEQLTPYYEQAKAFTHYDPSTLRSMMYD
ncbi:MAG: hypothetical protein R8J94_15460 [Acidimicrobiia bacterium]|nr:hypothetical protein [Acidimicrobiia bacterium]